MRLGIKEIQEIIPHRHPFLLIDFIDERAYARLATNQLPLMSRSSTVIFRDSRLCREC